jgi:insulysin
VVQSEKTPGYLEQRVEAFLHGMHARLEEMTAEELEEHKASLRKKWLENVKNLAEESALFQAHVTSGHWDFLRSMFSAK